MVKDHSDSERGNPLPPHGLLFPTGWHSCPCPSATMGRAFVCKQQWRSRGYFHPGSNIYGRPYWCSRNTFASEIAAPSPTPPYPHYYLAKGHYRPVIEQWEKFLYTCVCVRVCVCDSKLLLLIIITGGQLDTTLTY